MSQPNPALQVEDVRRAPALVSVDGRTYPLRSAQLRARAEGGVASSTLLQTFANPYEELLEVIYTMPLPADGAVLGYTVRLGEKVIRGLIDARWKAEADYRQALYEGRTAGLLEQDRADTFHQRLGNLPPHTEVTVEIEVVQPLQFLLGTGGRGPVWEYRFPTVVGPRYQGAPGRVGDAERLDVDRASEGGNPSRLALELVLADTSSTDAVASQSHDIETHAEAAGVIVRLKEGVRLDRDLVVHWTTSSPEVGIRVIVGPGNAGDTGRYALITVTPPAVPAAARPRDLTILLDASGSMAGPPLAFAKRVVTEVLQTLESGDRFEVIAFASTPRSLTRGLERPTPAALDWCLREISELRAGGGTEMGSAIQAALLPLRTDAQHQVVLVSDGYVGFEQELLTQIARNLPAGVRLHTVGIGSAPNRALTQSLARGGRGVELLAGDEASALSAARRLCAATVRPLLTDLSVSGRALRAIAPVRPRDVLAGQPLVLAALLHERGGPLEISGTLAGSNEPWSCRVEVSPKGETAVAGGAPAPELTSLPIGALFGREAIADAEFRQAAGEDAEEIRAEITSLGLRHRITSRYTSLVALAEEPTVDPALRRRERLAVELPTAVSAEGLGLQRDLRALTLGRALFTMAGTPSLKDRGAMRGAPESGVNAGALLSSVSKVPDPNRRARIRASTVVYLSGSELALQFASPFRGFQLPMGEVVVLRSRRWGTLGKRRHLKATVVVNRSRPHQPTVAGFEVRLALNLEGGKPWPEEERLVLRWGRISLEVFIAAGTSGGAQER